MKLEPWEIVLREQLGLDTKPAEAPAPKAPVDTDKTGTAAFLLLLCVLGLSIIYLYDDKTGGRMKNWVVSRFHTTDTKVVETPREPVAPSKPQEPPSKPVDTPKDTDVAKLRTDMEKQAAEYKAKYEELLGRINNASQRMGLMGIMLNENFNILNQNPNRDQLMFFNRDWTLDRMPRYIELSADDMEYLKKYVREGGQ
jgi:hypothetical protein